MKHLITPLAGAVIIGLGSFLSPSAVLAQGADDFVVEEIVVTARRRSESLQDVPGTVTAR
jgi:outer membrane receptor protein involved in Fe transport